MPDIHQSQVAAIFETARATKVLAESHMWEDIDAYSTCSPDAFDPVRYPTDTARIQAALDALKQLGGGICQLSAKTYNVTNITRWNNCCIEGVSFTATVLLQDDDAVGPVILDYPLIGSSTAVGGKGWMKNFMIKGNLAGVAKANANQTAGSANLTAVDSFTGCANGYIIEGVGIPNWTTVSSFNSGAGTLVMSANVMAGFTKAANKIIYRKAFTVTATHATSSKILTVTAGSLANVKVGMVCHGTNLDYDTDTGDDSSRITAVSVANNTITLDRKPLIDGSATVLCYVANDGILIAEPDYNPDKDPGEEYRAPTIEDVIVTQTSGNGLMARTGRDQLIIHSGKFTSAYGCNVALVSSNDSKIDGGIGLGTGWKGNLKLVSCSTPRLINFDCFDEAMPEKFAGMMLVQNRQVTISHGEINGTASVVGKTHAVETNHGIRFSHVNFKWHTGVLNPDGTSPQFLLVSNGADVVAENCYFYADKADNSCPNYLARVTGDSYLDLQRFRLITDVAVLSRPYKTGIVLVEDTSKIVGEYLDVTTSFIVRFANTAGVLDAVSAGAGAVGETKKVSVNSPGTACTTNTIHNLGSMTLEAGDWTFWGTAHFVLTGATVTKLEVGLPGNSASIPNGADQKAVLALNLVTTTGEVSVSVAPFKIIESATTTQRFNVRATFSAGTVSAYGTTNARRAR